MEAEKVSKDSGRSISFFYLPARIFLVIFLAGFLTLFLISSPLLSAEIAEEEELSLERAVQLMEEHSTDLKVAYLEMDNAEIEHEKSRAEHIRTESRLQKLSAELSYQQSRQQFRSTALGIYLEFMNDYHQLKLLDREVEAAGRNLELAEAELRDVEQKVEAGHEGRIELLRQQMEVNNARFELEEAEEDLEKKEREMRSTLELEELPPLTSELAPGEEPELPDRSQAVEKTLEHSLELEVSDLSLELAEIELERAEISDTSDLDMLEKENELELARLEYQQTEESVEEDALDQLHTVRQAGLQVGLSRDNLAQAEEHQRITREQRRAGLVSERELERAELEKIEAELDVQEALASRLASYLELQEMMGVEVEVIRDEILDAFTE